MNFLRTMQPYKNGFYRGHITGDEFAIKCPYHADTDPSLYVNLESGIFHCLGCKQSGWIPDLIGTLEGVSEYEARQIIRSRGGDLRSARQKQSGQMRHKKSDRFIEEDFFQNFFPVELESAYMDYLESRGISYRTAKAYDLRVGPLYDREWGQRVIYPVRDGELRLRSVKGRSIRPNTGLRYREAEDSKASAGFFFDKIPGRRSKYGYVCEGPFDAMALYETGVKPALSMNGSFLSDLQAQLLKRFCHTPVVLLDPVRPGTENKRHDSELQIKDTLSRYFTSYYVKAIPGSSDLSDLLKSSRKDLLKVVNKIQKEIENNGNKKKPTKSKNDKKSKTAGSRV